MNEHINPLIASVLNNFAGQPAQIAQLQRAAEKADERRFAERPEVPSAFAELDEQGDEGTPV